ncbi:MAG: hypothetical protein GF404_09985 [candidate division Zixibacteria bacterium]|nr:hypothetical protein [candidate division Zixibacteria bacterium]
MLLSCLKSISLGLLLAILFCGESNMALKLEIEIADKSYYPGQSIPVSLRLINDSGKSRVVPAFTYNSDLTEVMVYNSEREEVLRANDLVQQERLDFFPVELIDAPDDSLGPNDSREFNFDLVRYGRLLEPGKYIVQGSYRFYDQTLITAEIEIEIRAGNASGLQCTWQYRMGDKDFCHLIYREREDYLHLAGYDHNPAVNRYNRVVDGLSPELEYHTARSACDEEEDFKIWMPARTDDKLIGSAISGGEVVAELEEIRLNGEPLFDHALGTTLGGLIVPEVETLKTKTKIRLHLFDSDGKKTAENIFDAQTDLKLFDSFMYTVYDDLEESDESEESEDLEDYKLQYMLIYGHPVGKGYGLYLATFSEQDMSDLTTRKLYQSTREFLDVRLPDGLDVPGLCYAVSFKEDSKELWIYDIELDPQAKNYVPPKRVLKSDGDLAFHSLLVTERNTVYLMFVEVGHKLLLYDYREERFYFITEDKFTDPYILASPAGDIFVAYIDHKRLVRFDRMIAVERGR